jgi:ParB family chromosome partitioning protein
MAKQALNAKRLNAFSFDPDDLVIVGLDTTDGPDHPLYDERIKLAVNPALVANIQVYGVIEPVVVAKSDDVVVVVNGRQRVRAARAANEQLRKAGCELVSVPVILRRGEDGHLVGVMISANEQRTDDELPQKLKKLERLLALGRSEDEAACAFGVSKQTIKNWLTVAEASPELRKAVISGQLPQTAALQLAQLPRAAQAEALQELEEAAALGTKPTTEGARQLKQRKQDGPAVSPRPSRKQIRELRRTELEEVTAEPEYKQGFLAALKWVLGEAAELEVAVTTLSADDERQLRLS